MGKRLELRISRILYVMIIHLGWVLPPTSSGYLGKRRAHLLYPPFTLLQTGFTKLHKSPYGLVRFYRTVSPVQRPTCYIKVGVVVYFLLHFP